MQLEKAHFGEVAPAVGDDATVDVCLFGARRDRVLTKAVEDVRGGEIVGVDGEVHGQNPISRTFLAMMLRCTSLVPAPIVPSMASRQLLSTWYSGV